MFNIHELPAVVSDSALGGDSPVTVSSLPACCWDPSVAVTSWGTQNTPKDAPMAAPCPHPSPVWLASSSSARVRGRWLLIDVSFLCSLMKGSSDTKLIKTSRGGPRACL